MSCGFESNYMNKRAAKGERYKPTYHEQIANTFSHGVAILPSLFIGKILIDLSYRNLQFYITVSYCFFTTLLFFASTLYHLCELLYRSGKQKLRYYLHIADRIVIYFFIASSSMPWLNLKHGEYFGTNLQWIIWIFAFFGIIYQLNFYEKYKSIETLIYVINASIPFFVIILMSDKTGLLLMLIGGFVYAVGVIFFKLDGVIPFAHAIWHLHVVIGVAIHTYAFYTTLLGPDKNNLLLNI